ncbi:MAG: tetratricopeptide repeat protein [Kordiimonadaceae bacterium]|jgi:tetratricopeptide (TPR) repeat protein|nr:tetratricopeptide repeat protein [Kordiimonadaceae bacterium]MBT6033099.1 tetratricopeptide repeat protein [Kordiimonadaceae bacterium]
MSKTFNIKNITAVISIIIGLIAIPVISQAQVIKPWTGNVVGSTINLGSTSVLDDIRTALNNGETEDAVRQARKHVLSVERIHRGGELSTVTYHAYNTLCVSLTANGEFDEAIKACDRAITDYPKKWEAHNSRGSMHYRSGKFTEALKDYQNALNRAPDADHITRVINHNIQISEGKVASNR